MISFEEEIKDKICKAIEELYATAFPLSEISLQETRKEFSGDVTLVVFPFIKISKKSPEATAEEIGSKLKASSEVIAEYNVVKGFLNLTITDQFWKNFFEKVAGDQSLLFDPEKNKQFFPAKKYLMV